MLAWLVVLAFAASFGGVALTPVVLQAAPAAVHPSASTAMAMAGQPPGGRADPCREHTGKAACGGACPLCASVIVPAQVGLTAALVAAGMPPLLAPSDQSPTGLAPGRLERPPRSNG